MSTSMIPPVRILVPGTTPSYRCGGLSVELDTASILSDLTEVEIVTYRQRERNFLYLDDIIKRESNVEALCMDQPIWIISWGFHVKSLLARLKGRRCVYHAHSTGYKFNLPIGLPIVAVSRNTLGYWGDRASRNPLFLVPNCLGANWNFESGAKDWDSRQTDILIQKRKSSNYLLNQLAPKLRQMGLKVVIIDGWVDNLAKVFADSKVYLYDSSEHWRCEGLTEGFGLPPIEALASGCIVFTSFNHALADYIDIGSNAHQIGAGTLSYDLDRIHSALLNPQDWRANQESIEQLTQLLSRDNARRRWNYVIQEISSFYERYSDEKFLEPRRRSSLYLSKYLAKVRKIATSTRFLLNQDYGN